MSILKKLESAWISPTGRVVVKHEKFFNERSWHNELALCLLADIWKIDDILDAFEKMEDENSFMTATDNLEKLGWIRLHTSVLTKFLIPKKATKKQERTILDWCIENNITYKDAIE